MQNKKLIELAESLLEITNQESKNIKMLERTIQLPGSQEGTFAALKEGIELLIESHEFRTRLAYEARKAAYDNDQPTVSFCVDAIAKNIKQSEKIRKEMTALISATIGANNE